MISISAEHIACIAYPIKGAAEYIIIGADSSCSMSTISSISAAAATNMLSKHVSHSAAGDAEKRATR
jgi:hypothetical protein